MYGKHLELLKEVVPNLGRVAVLSNPAFSTSALLLNVLQTSAPALGLSLQIVEARQPDELEPAVAAAVAQHAMALVVILDSMFIAQREQLAELVARYRLPAIYGIEEHVTAGGLMAYAASRPEIFRRAATFVDKILKGAKPADLPVEQPTKFLLIINLKTAKALGLAIPDKLLAVADEVID
jgi:putative ABC transport system substrate-binding protein